MEKSWVCSPWGPEPTLQSLFVWRPSAVVAALSRVADLRPWVCAPWWHALTLQSGSCVVSIRACCALLSCVADPRPLMWFFCCIVSIWTWMRFICDHELVPADCLSSLESCLRRGVVSSKAASQLTPQGGNATTTTLTLLQRRYTSKDRLVVLVLARL